MERTGWIGERNCAGCRYWSEMIAKAEGSRVVAMCLADGGPRNGEYMSGAETCSAFARNTFGAVDDPPDYGEQVRALYAAEAALKHENGRPQYAPDGTMLDDRGNRSDLRRPRSLGRKSCPVRKSC
jgi:hypothetical protein